MGTIRILKHGEPDLYLLIGPLAMRRDVHKALGEPVFDGEGLVWFVMTEGDRDTVGFCALRPGRDCLWYDYAYVVPEKRGKGHYGRLYAAREAYADVVPDAPALRRTVVCADRWPRYAERGWKEHHRRGRWVYGYQERKPQERKPEASHGA